MYANAISHPAVAPRRPARRILIVDDSQLQRRILTYALERWGYLVDEADTGTRAIELCHAAMPDLIISNWVMPEMSGVQLCEAVRAMSGAGYTYFILLTSKSGREDTTRGFEAGVDDYLAKPVAAPELRARLTAAERIVGMERDLQDKNRIIGSALTEIGALYTALDNDLIEAKRLQRSLLPECTRDFGAVQVSLLLQSSGHLGGDLVSYFPIGDSRLGFYGLDVSGHGISSALMTARLAGLLSHAAPQQNIALVHGPDGSVAARDPAEVAAQLNRLILADRGSDHYLTLLLGNLDLATGRVVLTQAGHPHPIVQRKNGAIETIGRGGFPVGLLPAAEYGTVTAVLRPGDRLIVLSDGITDIFDAADHRLPRDAQAPALTPDALADVIRANRGLTGADFLSALVNALVASAGGADIADDVSAILIDYSGPDQEAA